MQPLCAPIDKYARFALLEDELIDERCASPTNSKGFERNVRVDTGSPQKIYRPILPVNVCAGKGCADSNHIMAFFVRSKRG